ncbi:AmpG family muropeptide MFS transporter [Francisella salimarina]|uniref:MFS transporter n=1 Tax=Francisella salimarina TaxID=2599927 RepID=A0AAJ4TKT2_9GAMM|nr:MFS transporter [Francisella salimarina]QWU99148.1 MFS transporter [Francisella salimarina]
MNSSPTFGEKLVAPFKQPKMLTMLILGYASGLPLMLTASSLLLWYRDSGINIQNISFLTLIAIPYTFKYLWAPFLDKINILNIGRRKGWILTTQVALIILIALMSQLSPANQPLLIAFIGFMICFTSATQDIAINAYQTEVLNEREKALGNAIAVMGYRIAMLVTGSLVLIFADYYSGGAEPIKICTPKLTEYYGASTLFTNIDIVSTQNIISNSWSLALVTILAFFIICPLYCIFLRESASTIAPKNFKEAFTEPFIEFFKRQGIKTAIIILLIIIGYKLADAIAFSLNTVFFADLGFDKTTIAVSYKAFSLAATLIGLITGGLIANKIGIFKSFLFFSIIMASANLMYVLLAIVGKNYYLMVSSVAVEYFCGAMGTAILVAMIMSLVNIKFSATQFAVLSSIDSLGRVLVGPFAGYVQSHYNWEGLFIASFIIGILISTIIYIFRNRIKLMANIE